MNLDYLENIPQWFEEQTELDLVLSNDIDSLLSCALLKAVKGWNVRYFYNFEKCYASRELKKRHERCWVDIAVLNGEKSFDNHVSMISFFDKYNEQMINPNLVANITNDNYPEKYAGSTALLIWSIYDLPLPKTEEGKMLLLCIDSTFKGHYCERFAEANQFYLCDMFGFGELYDVMERHSITEFYSLMDKYKVNEPVAVRNGKLYTKLNLKVIGELLGVDLQLPGDSFLLWQEYEIEHKKIDIEYIGMSSDISENIFTLAFTYKNKIRYSKLKQKGTERNEILCVS